MIEQYLNETIEVIKQLDTDKIRKIHNELRILKGRLFILGIGGSAANASHAVGDFRKIMRIEAHAPTDNIAELTARTNDDGWENIFIDYLENFKLNSNDCILVLSVGGGSCITSHNIVKALDYAKNKNVTIIGIVGRNGGYTAKVADICIIIPTVNKKTITPHTEELQSIILHLLVNL